MDHGQKNGGGTWHNADYTGTEFPGPFGRHRQDLVYGFHGCSFCERQEWEPITAGIIGCHYERERIVKYKLGDVWEQRTEFATDDPNATGFRAAYPRALSPFHTYSPGAPKDAIGARLALRTTKKTTSPGAFFDKGPVLWGALPYIGRAPFSFVRNAIPAIS